MRRTLLTTLLFILVMWNFAGSQTASPGYKVIVNEENPVSEISVKELSKIFLKRIRKWDNGEKILPVDLEESSPARESFSREVHQKKVSAIKAYWQKQIFTGRGVPPPEKDSPREVLQYIEEHEGAIGYIPENVSIENFKVKVIRVKAED
ncbi:MAG: phosphate ABC transporter substrate-binding protein [Calditrichaeota bacterium]|nr:MAG: phosphate ABC transporter substrate-binding protein [Calditrichota bacterium]